MGIFSGKKKTYVSSATYPLGEDGTEDTGSLRRIVINSVLQNRPLQDGIQNGYLKGQGMALRKAFLYARDEYVHGVASSAFRYLDQPDTTVITPIVQPKHPGSQIIHLTTFVGPADYEWWAEEYLTKQFGYDRVLKEFARPPQGVEADANVAYDLEPDGRVRILLINSNGATKVIDFRPTGYLPLATFLHCVYLARKVFTTLDQTTTRAATPGEVDSVSVSTTEINRIGELQVTVDRTEIDVTGATAVVHRTVTTTVTSRPQYLLYKLGSGTYPTLDAWTTDDALDSPYYPSIPLRVNNVNLVTEANKDTELYKTSAKLLRKVGANYEKLGTQVNTNPSVGDIDFAFVVFGVGLNNQSQEAKRYLYRFFEHLRGISQVTVAQWNEWQSAVDASPLVKAVVPPPTNMLQIYSEKDRANNHDVKLSWQCIDTTIHNGLAFTGAKPRDVYIGTDPGRTEYTMADMDMMVDASGLYARRQIDADTYEQMKIVGLVYENFIYQGKAVTVTAFDAINNPDDQEGFIVPLNQGIIRSTPLIELTDLSYQCCHMVFNCYKVVKQKWYQTGIFKVILIIIAVVLCFFFPPAGVTMLATMLGGYLLLAAIIYVAAMMLIMKLIMNLAVEVLGDKWGPIIMAIVMFVSMNWSNLGNIAAGTANAAMTAQVILGAVVMVSNAYGAYAADKMSQIQKEALGLQTEFDRQMKEIEDLTKMNLDTSLDMIDIQGYTQAALLQFESHQAFLDRTLLTGSDICELTSSMVDNFAAVGLALPTTG